jgi:hypothetical protein
MGLIYYLAFIVSLFVVCLAVAGLRVALLVFGAIHLSCVLAIVALWWAEVQWAGTAGIKNLKGSASHPGRLH